MHRNPFRRRLPAASLLLAAAALAGCKSTDQPPKGEADTKLHPEFATMRPVVIVVLRVESPSSSFAPRRALYDELFAKRYSPVRVERVEAHTSSNGVFDGEGIAWDAKLIVRLNRWQKLSGGVSIANVDATLVHRTGETLWECRARGLGIDTTGGMAAAESRFARALLSHLPDLPPGR